MIPYQCCSFIPFHARVRHAQGFLEYVSSFTYRDGSKLKAKAARTHSKNVFAFILLFASIRASPFYVNYDKERREKGKERNLRNCEFYFFITRTEILVKMLSYAMPIWQEKGSFNFLLSNINHRKYGGLFTIKMEFFLPFEEL